MKKIIKRAAGLIAAAAVALGAVPIVTSAENPIIQTSFTPDPAPVVFGDELWVFTGRDNDGNNNDYIMTGWQCFSTTDMKNWTDHGCFLEDDGFEWCNANAAWASQCIERNGKYYFYFTTTNKGGGGRAIGVGVADKPEGPYTDVLKKPLCGPNWDYIDPTVIIDDDGQAWLMFGNPKCYYVKLKEDMVTLDGPIQTFNLSLPSGTRYGEGPWIYKHDSLYYLVFASFVDGFGGESISYCTGPTVTGPWTFRGTIHEGSNCFTTHGGIIDYKGHSYSFYHMNGLPVGGAYNRSAACEEFTYGADGSIPALKSTRTGPEQIESFDPYQRVEAETMSWSSGIKTEKIDAGTLAIGYIENGDYTKISGVDFGDGADTFTASVASNTNGGAIELHIDSLDGDIIGTCDVPGTEGWQNWQEVSAQVEVSGEHDLYMKFTGDSDFLFNVDWWKFSGAGAPALEEGVLYHSTFERSSDGWSSRAGADVTMSSDNASGGEKSAFVSGRENPWQGVAKKLGKDFKPGESYSFSANAMSPDEDTKFHLTLQYTLDEDVYYKKIDSSEAPAGKWVQLCGNDFTLPEGAEDMYVYVETDTGSGDFYADEMIGAVEGTDLADLELLYALPGDVDQNGRISVFDMISAKGGYISGFAKPRAKKSADTNGNGDVELSDLVLLQKYILGSISEFPED